ALADKRVAAQSLDVHRPHRDAGHVCVAPDVVQVVDREDPRQEWLEPADPARHRRVEQGWLRDEEGDPARVDRLAWRERVAFGHGPWCPAQASDQGRQLALDDQLAQVLMSQPFGPRPAGIGWRLEGDQDMLIEEVGKRTMTDVVEQARDPEGLDHHAFGGNRITARGQGGSKAGIEAAGPG